jgi:hypothetical protein
MINETKIQKLKELYGKTLTGEFPSREEFSAALKDLLSDFDEDEKTFFGTFLYGEPSEAVLCIVPLCFMIPDNWWISLLRDLRAAGKEITP